MVKYAGKDTVMSFFIVEFNVPEYHLAGLKPQRVILDNEGSVGCILNKVGVLNDRFTLHIHVRQVTKQAQMTGGAAPQLLKH